MAKDSFCLVMASIRQEPMNQIEDCYKNFVFSVNIIPQLILTFACSVMIKTNCRNVSSKAALPGDLAQSSAKNA